MRKSDKAEWLYVLEINPGQRIKVGRTTDLRSRVTSHIDAAEFGGGEITQVYTVVCPESRAAEFELIARMAAQPGAEVVLGREMFAGVRFRVAVDLAESIAREARRKAMPQAPPLTGQLSVTRLLSDCVTAFDGADRIHLATLALQLAESSPSIYGGLNTMILGTALRAAGIRTAQIRVGGLNKRGLRITDLTEIRPGETGEVG